MGRGWLGVAAGALVACSSPAQTEPPQSPVAQETPPVYATTTAARHPEPVAVRSVDRSAAAAGRSARTLDRRAVRQALAARRPRVFGTSVPGVVERLDADGDALALTVDLCGGHGESAFDRGLFELAARERI